MTWVLQFDYDGGFESIFNKSRTRPYCNTYVKLVIYVTGIKLWNSNIHDMHIAICSMLALECQYICHVLYFKLCNNIQPKIKCELNILTKLS